MPKSEKIIDVLAPASSIASTSRLRDTPVALHAATSKPKWRSRPTIAQADAFAEVGKAQHGAEHLAVERRANVGVGRIADAEYAAYIQKLDRVARLERGRQVARVAAQRLAMTERADDDVALVDCGHAARRQLELVVTRLGVEHPGCNEHAFLARDVLRHAQLGGEVVVLGDRCDLVDEDALHAPARVCKVPGSDRIRA
jgi:hypothetical protein